MAVRGAARRRSLSGPGHRRRTRISEDRPLETLASADRPERGAQRPAALAVGLCRLTSGGAFSARRLFTDQDEILFAAARPIILNVIEEVITRPDLADRYPADAGTDCRTATPPGDCAMAGGRARATPRFLPAPPCGRARG